jgi:RNA polymerase sigma-70 factor (ECF subfamily)
MSLRSTTLLPKIEQAVPALRRFARALIARTGATQNPATNQVLADDLVHETVLLALRSERSLDLSRPIRLSLFSSLIGFHAVHLKQAGFIQPNAHVASDFNHNVEQGLIAALDRLTFEDRVVLLLINLEQMSYDEVADVLHITRALVIQRLVRARNQLARSMTGQQAASSLHPHLRLVK